MADEIFVEQFLEAFVEVQLLLIGARFDQVHEALNFRWLVQFAKLALLTFDGLRVDGWRAVLVPHPLLAGRGGRSARENNSCAELISRCLHNHPSVGGV